MGQAEAPGLSQEDRANAIYLYDRAKKYIMNVTPKEGEKEGFRSARQYQYELVHHDDLEEVEVVQEAQELIEATLALALKDFATFELRNGVNKGWKPNGKSKGWSWHGSYLITKCQQIRPGLKAGSTCILDFYWTNVKRKGEGCWGGESAFAAETFLKLTKYFGYKDEGVSTSKKRKSVFT